MGKKAIDIVKAIEVALLGSKEVVDMNIAQCKQFIEIGKKRIASNRTHDEYDKSFEELWEKLIIERTKQLEKWENHVTQK